MNYRIEVPKGEQIICLLYWQEADKCTMQKHYKYMYYLFYNVVHYNLQDLTVFLFWS